MPRDAAGRSDSRIRSGGHACRPSAAAAGGGDVGGGDTSYVCVVDRHGNAFSATPSDSSWDGPVIPGLGFVSIHARVAVLGGAGPRLLRGARASARG